jgi:ketosteroid isomerase-like protein
MTRTLLAATLSLLLAPATALAQSEGSEADHDALRKLKADLLTAINTRNLSSVEGGLHKPFSATVVTQETFTDAGAMQAYYDGLFTRKLLRMSRIHMQAEADELSQIYTGTYAVARGSTQERYELADGRSFDMRGRWTAVAVKQEGQWKVLAVHSGTNFLDNPVLTAIEKSTATIGAGGLGVGLLLGGALGFFVGRRRRAAATAA